jgi:hypothetical protein
MDLNYTRNLIKGKITEVIFEEMFRTSGEFDIIPIGYEHTTPILAQYQHHFEIRQVLDNIRNAPDFALISQDKTKVFLVEIKYREKMVKSNLLYIAEKTIGQYNPCFLFIATKDKFYFSPCKSVINSNGELEELRESWIKKEIQRSYLLLLKSFV